MSDSKNSTANDDTHLTAFKAVVESRRSVRRFTDDPLPSGVLNECLRLAMLAPNSSNLQPWSFYVFESPKLRKQANDICLGQNAATTAACLLAVVAHTDTWLAQAKRNIQEYPIQPVPKKVKDYYTKVVPLDFARGPANVLAPAKWGVIKGIRAVKGHMKSPYYSHAEVKNWATNNAALAAQNLMLALRAHGFDSCAMGGFDEPALKRLLGLTDHQHVVMMIGAGKRADNGIYSPQYRFDFNKFVHRV